MKQIFQEWRDIPGFKGEYAVNSKGLVLSRKRKKPRATKGSIARRYLTVKLYGSHLPKKGKTFNVHELIAEAFCRPRPPGTEVCHYDDDPTNNHAFNLRFDTKSANMRDQKFNSAPDRAQQIKGPVTFPCLVHGIDVTDKLTGEFDTCDCLTYSIKPERCIDCLADSGLV